MKNKKIGNHISSFYTIFIFRICWNIPRWNGKTFHFLVISITFRCEILNHNDFFLVEIQSNRVSNLNTALLRKIFRGFGEIFIPKCSMSKSSQFFFLFGQGGQEETGDRQQLTKTNARVRSNFSVSKTDFKILLEKNSTSLKCRWPLW